MYLLIVVLGSEETLCPVSGQYLVRNEWRKVAAFLLREVYYSFRLWLVPAPQYNQTDLRKLIDVIKYTDFFAVPADQAFRANITVDHSPGRTIRGGDYLFYDP